MIDHSTAELLFVLICIGIVFIVRVDLHRMDQNRLLEQKLKMEREQFEYTKSLHSEILNAIKTIGFDYITFRRSTVYNPSSLLELLNTLIDTEFKNFIMIPRSGKNLKPRIDDIKASADEICVNVINGLTQDFYENMRSAGLSEDYILTYVTRECFAKIIAYTRDIRRKENG